MGDLAKAAAKLAPAAKNLRILIFDIETAPHVVHAWGLFKQNVGINQIVEPGRVLGYAWKWVGQKPVHWMDESGGHKPMIEHAHKLLTEADVVVGYNSSPFDVPHMNREFVLAGLTPPKPYKQVDLLKTVRRQFKFASGKLDWVSQQLGLGAKVKHEGHDLWKACMAGDLKAWSRMGKYARQDVALTEKLFHVLLPWLTQVPHIGQLAQAGGGCWACGSEKLARDGSYTAYVTSYPLHRCTNCGAWVRGTNKLEHVTKTRQAKL
jgi:DNA polymerase elongation subunit (family B)